MLVVRQISTGRFVYSQDPPFRPGKGILNAIAHTGLPADDLEEVEVPQAAWTAELSLQADERKEAQLNSPVIKAIIDVVATMPEGLGFRANVKALLK